MTIEYYNTHKCPKCGSDRFHQIESQVIISEKAVTPKVAWSSCLERECGGVWINPSQKKCNETIQRGWDNAEGILSIQCG